MNRTKERKTTRHHSKGCWDGWRARFTLIVMVLALAFPNAVPTFAATGSLYAKQITAPGGGV